MCLNTIKIYIGIFFIVKLYYNYILLLENIVKNPTEEKYRKIKLENNAFKTRV